MPSCITYTPVSDPYRVVRPPSTLIAWPWMYDAFGPHRWHSARSITITGTDAKVL